MQLQSMPTHEQVVINPNNPQNHVVYQVQQPVQVTPTPYSNVGIPPDFVNHSSIPNEVIWLNMSVAKVSVTQSFSLVVNMHSQRQSRTRNCRLVTAIS